MKRLTYLAMTVLALSGLSSCTSYNYYQAAINKTNMSGYHTFAWMPPAKGSANTTQTVAPAADLKIKDATTQALVAKGLKLSQDHPDLVISYSDVVGKGTRTDYYSPYWGGWGPGWGFGWGGGWGFYRPYYAFGGPFPYYGGLTYADKEHFKEGTLIIDLIDTHTRKIVWRGFGVGEVHHDQQKNVDDLPKVVNGILEQLQVMPTPPARMKQS
jgi:hypothetical protein